MMSRRLPPLNALRAFEAAARHLSFTKAADELNVTPAAVSHQVKALEAYCGQPLFRRLTRALLLTDAGQAALPALGEGFDRLAEAAVAMAAGDGATTLTLSTTPSFAAKWLIRRLIRFQKAHPDINVRIDATNDLADFERDGVDVVVRFGGGRYPGLRADKLFDEEITPVCAPGLTEGPDGLRNPEDLPRFTLLHVSWDRRSESEPNWQMWVRTAGVAGVDTSRGIEFSYDSLAVEAAIEGQGVAIINRALVADDLAAGRLVKPFELSLATSFAYHLVCPEATSELPRIVAFRNWILAEAGGGDA